MMSWLFLLLSQPQVTAPQPNRYASRSLRLGRGRKRWLRIPQDPFICASHQLKLLGLKTPPGCGFSGGRPWWVPMEQFQPSHHDPYVIVKDLHCEILSMFSRFHQAFWSTIACSITE